MKKDEVMNMFKKIGTEEDEVKRREYLTDISEEIENLFTENEQFKTKAADLESANETLREANMKLFLRVGGKEEPDESAKEKEEEKEPRRFEDLFTEKGGLK